MAMKQCDAGIHFYSEEVYETCPYCNEGSSDIESNSNSNAAKTQGDNMEHKTQPIVENAKTTPLDDRFKFDKDQISTRPINPVNPSPKTTILTFDNDKKITSSETGVLPVAGWLVIIEGEGKGKDFRLIQGENKIGRDASMEVCLDFGKQSDASVSRDTHAVVVYDNNSNEFFVERGSSRNLPTVNGKTVRRDQDLQANDIIQLGETQLMFFPLCGEKFKW